MADAVNTKAINGARSQEIVQAQAAFDLYDATYERAKVLLEGGAISQQKFDEIETQRNVVEQTLSMAIEGARTEDKAAAYAQLALSQSGVTASEAVYNQAMEASNIAFSQITQANAGLVAAQGVLAQATAGLAEVNVYLNDTLLTAPIDGTVTSLNSDEGELVSTGTSIGTICNLDTCWITVNLDEDKLIGIVEGSTVDVDLLAYEGQTFKGTVVTINKQPDFAIKKATSENGNFDIVSFGVKIMLENDEDVLRPGMTALVDFGI
jgi:HlyD family secretion protein